MADHEFEYERPIEVRYRDLDPLGHVNHAVYASYCEQARRGFLRDRVGRTSAGPNMVVVHLELDYERSIETDDEVTVAVAVTDCGETSFSLAYDLRADGDRAATAETTQVIVDGEGRPRALPDAWRDAFAPAADG